MKNNKKGLRFSVFFCIVLAAVVFSSAISVKAEVKLSKTSVTLLLGQEGKDTYVLSVSGTADGDKITFSSKDKTIATVDKKGKITAVAPGKTTVTCTVTSADGEKTEKKASVRVYDNIKSITLGIKDVQKNALHKNIAYALTYTCKTVAGTNKNVDNYIHYEVLTTSGKSTENASVDSEGNFTAKRCSTYVVYAYAFQSSTKYKEWSENREKYAGNILAQDTLSLTVTQTQKEFRTQTQEIGDFSVTLPAKYEINVSQKTKDRTAFSAQVKNTAGQSAVSNIQVIIDQVEKPQSYALLSEAMTSVYTKEELERSWRAAYNAQKATVSKLKTEKITAGEREILKISYNLVLRSIVLSSGNTDVKISRMDFVNTVYTWYDGNYHISVTVTDALEALHPNISDAAQKMVEEFVRGTVSKDK